MSTERLAAIYTKWLRAGPLIEGFFVPYAADDPRCAEEDACLDPARVIIFSIVAHFIILNFAAVIMRNIQSYQKLDFENKLYWCTAIVSSIHAIVAAQGALRLVFRGEVGVVGRDPTQDYYSANSAGYFIYDLIVILAAYKYKLFNSSAMLIHHIYAGFGYIYIINHPTAWHAAVWLATELSTPFVNFRWFLSKMGYKDHPIYIFNGVLMVLVFFTIRVGMVLWYWYHFSMNFELIRSSIDPVSFFLLMLGAGLGTVLNTMWFTIMCKGLIKVIKGEGKEPDDGPDTDKAAVHKDQKDSAKVLKNGANNTPAKESKKKK